MSVAAIYRQLAIDTFIPQWVADLDDDDRLLEICVEEIEKAGYPCSDENEDDWLEYVYMAQEMWLISRTGYVYCRERNPNKRDGWEFVLYTRANHPAFKDE